MHEHTHTTPTHPPTRTHIHEQGAGRHGVARTGGVPTARLRWTRHARVAGGRQCWYAHVPAWVYVCNPFASADWTCVGVSSLWRLPPCSIIVGNAQRGLCGESAGSMDCVRVGWREVCGEAAGCHRMTWTMLISSLQWGMTKRRVLHAPSTTTRRFY